MPFQYKPKESASRRKPFTKQQIANAIKDVEKGMSLRKTATKYDIDRTTLGRYVQDTDKVMKFDETGSQYKSTQIVSQKEEKILVDYLLECSKMHFGLTKVAAMKLASEYAIAIDKNVPESWKKNKTTGKDWFRGFIKRNPQLNLRTPEATSLS